MIKYLLFLLPIYVFSAQITIEHAVKKPLGKIIRTNAQITQLSEQKQKIVSKIPGHIEHYFVKTGQKVKKGSKVALIESIELSKMSAEYLALTQQKITLEDQLLTTKKLYKKGLLSQNDLNTQIIALQEIQSKQNALSSQLKSLGVNITELTKATDQLILYAHADGIVGKILAPLHSNVNAQEPLMSLVNQSVYYVIAYLNVKDAMKVTSKTTGFITVASKIYPVQFVQLLPNVDEETQRAKVLFMITDNPKNLLLGAFIEMEISFEPYQDAIMVKKSALTLYQGEWVVFVEADHKRDEEKHEGNVKHDDHEGHLEEGEEHEEHEELAYIPKAVKIIEYSGNDVAIEGLSVEEEYVSDGVYFVKSMLLKSSLGEHGH